MDLILYTVNNANNVINKIIENGLSLTIRLKSDTDIVNPSIMLADAVNVDYTDYNYAYIPYLKRYYFIAKIDNVNNRLWNLHLECDVVETYKADILNSHARFKRKLKNGDYINSDIDYSVVKTATLYHSDTVAFTDEKSAILTTLGV